jgi:2'-5' RNA ligase
VRAFWAIELPEELRAALAREGRALAQASRGVRVAREGSIHLTLAFLGEVHEEHVDRLTRSVAAALQDREPLRFGLAGAGRFPPRGAPRVAWIGVGEGREGCVDIASRVALACGRAGYPGDPRSFHPHVTVARFQGGGAALAAALDRWESRIGEAPFGSPFLLSRVVLFESLLQAGGSVYRERGEAPLAGAPEAA